MKKSKQELIDEIVEKYDSYGITEMVDESIILNWLMDGFTGLNNMDDDSLIEFYENEFDGSKVTALGNDEFKVKE